MYDYLHEAHRTLVVSGSSWPFSNARTLKVCAMSRFLKSVFFYFVCKPSLAAVHWGNFDLLFIEWILYHNHRPSGLRHNTTIYFVKFTLLWWICNGWEHCMNVRQIGYVQCILDGICNVISLQRCNGWTRKCCRRAFFAFLRCYIDIFVLCRRPKGLLS
jgi:hypothetical protein